MNDYWASVVDSIKKGADDLEVLQIAHELLKDEIERLSSNLEEYSIKREHTTLIAVEILIREMIENYV